MKNLRGKRRQASEQVSSKREELEPGLEKWKWVNSIGGWKGLTRVLGWPAFGLSKDRNSSRTVESPWKHEH